MRAPARLSLTAALAGLLGCSQAPSYVIVHQPVATVKVTPAFDTIPFGGAVSLKVTTLDVSGDPTIPDKHPVWSSLNAAVLSVDTSGNVAAVWYGQGTIRVVVDGVEGDAVVVVLPPRVNKVAVTSPRPRMERGDTVQLHVSATNEAQLPVPVTGARWSASDTTKLRVDSTGRAVGVGIGTVTVRVTFAGLADSTSETVLVPAATITLTPNTVTLPYDGSSTMVVVVRDSAGNILTDRSASLAAPANVVQAPQFVTASDSFVISGAGPGVASVIVSAGRAADTVSVTVLPPRYQQLALGFSSACGLAADSSAYCWGDGSGGMLGTGDLSSGARPRHVIGGLKFTSVSVSADIACGVRADGAGYCWGRSDYGQLGPNAGPPCQGSFGTIDCTATPVPVSTSLRVSTIAGGQFDACGLSTDQKAYCWGNPWGTTPVEVTDSMTFTALQDNCGLATDSTVYCWNYYRPITRPFSDSLRLVTVTPSAFLTCGLTAAGGLYCWGWLPAAQNSWTPTPLTQLFPAMTFTSVVAGESHLCAITSAGAAVCWGANDYGQLGDGTTTSDFGGAPVTVRAPVSFVSLQSGPDYTCGIGADGLAYCWGRNDSNQLGSGSGAFAALPQAIMNQR